MRALVLAGGLGTRLGGLTENKPKPFLEVNGGKSCLYRILEKLAKTGVDNVMFNARECFKDQVEKFFVEENADLDLELDCSLEPEPFGSAGTLKSVEKWFKEDPHATEGLVLMGDTLTNVDLYRLINAHRAVTPWQPRPLATLLAYWRKEDRSQYGQIRFHLNGGITNFLEKSEEDLGGYCWTGIMAFNYELFDHLPETVPCDLSLDVFPALIENKQELRVHCTSSFEQILDIGTPENYKKAQTETFFL